MVSENLKEWVKNKREDGISDERIKKSLERTGHDPSIVDELDNPFDDDNVSDEVSDEDFEASDHQSDDGFDNSEDSGKDFDLSEQDELDTESLEEDIQGSEEEPQDTKSKLKQIESDFHTPDSSSLSLSRNKIGAGIFLIILLAGGVAVYSFAPDNFNIDGFNLFDSVKNEAPVAEPGSLERLDSQHSGCPDSAVRVQSVSSSEGTTTADVSVSREEAKVALIVTQNGEVLDFTTDTILGESQMTVNAVGNQVELRPLGCKDRFSRRDY